MTQPETHAARLLLEAHLQTPLGQQEREMAEGILRFIDAHPDCLHRSCLEGHLTGSAWITDAKVEKTLLTHHRKLNKWLQLGGHADGEPDILQVALKEAREESGLQHFELASPRVFDVDSHWIPERKGVPAHWHHDLRFHLIADPAEPFVVSDESHDLAWVSLSEVERLNPEESMLRMVRKSLQREQNRA